jgi:hypothetical protein
MSEKFKVIAAVVGVLIIAVIWNVASNKINQKSIPNTTQSQTSTERQTAVRLNGSGDRVKTVLLKRGLAIFTNYYGGSDNFIVVLKDSEGKILELLANEIGAYSGQKSLNISREGTYLLEITAGGNGKWQIDIE